MGWSWSALLEWMQPTETRGPTTPLRIPVEVMGRKPAPVAIPPKPAALDPIIVGPVLEKLGWTDPFGYARPMDAACITYGITGRLRMAAFLGQVGHESGRGRYTKEIWGPTEAQKRYEGKKDLGNIRPGDGSWFRGRGLLQITGRLNYEEAAKALDVPLDRLPAWLESREGAVTSAAWWWREHGCNELADKAGSMEGFEALTRRINGGINGFDERMALYRLALKVLG